MTSAEQQEFRLRVRAAPDDRILRPFPSEAGRHFPADADDQPAFFGRPVSGRIAAMAWNRHERQQREAALQVSHRPCVLLGSTQHAGWVASGNEGRPRHAVSTVQLRELSARLSDAKHQFTRWIKDHVERLSIGIDERRCNHAGRGRTQRSCPRPRSGASSCGR